MGTVVPWYWTGCLVYTLLGPRLSLAQLLIACSQPHCKHSYVLSTVSTLRFFQIQAFPGSELLSIVLILWMRMHQYYITVSTICHPVGKRTAIINWMTCCQKAGFVKAQVIMCIQSCFVKKKTGDLWMCIDYRQLNSNTKLD